METSSGWDTNLITAGATLDAPASIVHLPDNDTLAVVYAPAGDAAIHVAWGSGAAGGTWDLTTLDLGVDVVGASLAAAYDENLTLWALTENATLANLSRITVDSSGQATVNATLASGFIQTAP